jgi:hypothetical protein
MGKAGWKLVDLLAGLSIGHVALWAFTGTSFVTGFGGVTPSGLPPFVDVVRSMALFVIHAVPVATAFVRRVPT